MLSILICTYERPHLVETLIKDLERAAALAPSGWEIIVVDNYGDVRTREICDQSYLASTKLKYVLEPEPGLSAARNKAVLEASGQWFLFLDDDVRVCEDFISKMLEGISLPDVGVICPKLITPIQENWPGWLQIRVRSGVGQFNLGGRSVELDQTTKIPVGACMCLERSVYERFGPFSTNIGRSGKKLYGGEETVLFDKAFMSRVKGIYLPNITVLHEFVSEKNTKSYWRRQGFYGGRSFVRMLEIRSGKKITNQQALTLVVSSLSKATIRLVVACIKPMESFENQYRAIAHFGRAYEAISALHLRELLR